MATVESKATRIFIAAATIAAVSLSLVKPAEAGPGTPPEITPRIIVVPPNQSLYFLRGKAVNRQTPKGSVLLYTSEKFAPPPPTLIPNSNGQLPSMAEPSGYTPLTEVVPANIPARVTIEGNVYARRTRTDGTLFLSRITP